MRGVIISLIILFATGFGLSVFPLLRMFASFFQSRYVRLESLRPKSQMQQRVIYGFERLLVWTNIQSVKDKIKLAGYPFGLRANVFQGVRFSLVVALPCFWIGNWLWNLMEMAVNGFPLFRICVSILLGWYGPYVWLSYMAKRRRVILLYEVARLSHRLVVCMSDRTDLRDILLRAGRTCKELQPYLAELTLAWNKNQHQAILTFGERIGISEAYPLVNTLLAVSQVEVSQASTMLEGQVLSIEKSIEHDVARAIETVPFYIVFMIMVPFMAVFVLMIYPWISYMSELLFKSF